jgi:predicted HicB family RNase H-like nuclease
MQQMSLYIEPELKAKATALALAQSRSLNNFINLLIQQAVDQAEATGEGARRNNVNHQN